MTIFLEELMKKFFIINILLLNIIALDACTKKDSSIKSCEDSTYEYSVTSYSDSPSAASTINANIQPSTNEKVDIHDLEKSVSFTEKDLPVFSDDPTINHKYYELIVILEATGYLPNGEYCYSNNGLDFKTQKQQAYDDYLSIYDINGDLQNELLIRIGGTNNSDSADYIFVYTQQSGFTLLFDYYFGLEFYSNGIIYANVPHSQYMYNDDFWPYELYWFDCKEEKYVKIASVEELDINICPEYEYLFHDEYDMDNDNILYLVYYNGQLQYKDFKDYQLWKESIISDTKIELQWFEL